MQNNQWLSRWLVKEALMMRGELSGSLVQLGRAPRAESWFAKYSCCFYIRDPAQDHWSSMLKNSCMFYKADTKKEYCE
ncbi:hypothetical protein PAHAL_6G255300 [Panicum hallii]|uniref:Uncharacterized protein n=1 Tax=Panicum hallii TaxID=206008 RepID=A0A2T8IHH8_9POAL|nr:hypothetical protein PAHAL_6G255300 [Panicum hallii]